MRTDVWAEIAAAWMSRSPHLPRCVRSAVLKVDGEDCDGNVGAKRRANVKRVRGHAVYEMVCGGKSGL
jgi:hypothetical protein